MTDLREAAQQALEFLRILDYVPKRSPRFNKAITALEIALATSSDMEDVNAAFDAEYKKYKAEPQVKPYRPPENMVQTAAVAIELERVKAERDAATLAERKAVLDILWDYAGRKDLSDSDESLLKHLVDIIRARGEV